MTISPKAMTIPLYDKGVKRHKAQKRRAGKEKGTHPEKTRKTRGEEENNMLPIGQWGLRLEANNRKILNDGLLSFNFRLRVPINEM